MRAESSQPIVREKEAVGGALHNGRADRLRRVGPQTWTRPEAPSRPTVTFTTPHDALNVQRSAPSHCDLSGLHIPQDSAK